MNIEHFALNVIDPVAMAKWYVDHLDLKIVRQRNKAPFTTFLTDYNGQIMLELYCNSKAEIPDYPNQDPLVVHLAFADDQPEKTRLRLADAGATFVEEISLPGGGLLVMMRDPWGLAIQFCKR